MKYLSEIVDSNELDIPNKKSELFELVNWPHKYVTMTDIVACIEK